MRKGTIIFSLVPLLVTTVCPAQSSERAKNRGNDTVSFTTDQLRWQPIGAPGSDGLEIAVLQGDPLQPSGQYAVALKLADGHMIPPHWHPMDSNVVVVKGTLMMGFGDKLDPSKFRDLPAGSFVSLPKDVPLFEQAKGETVIYIYGPGPMKSMPVTRAGNPSPSSTRTVPNLESNNGRATETRSSQ